jgi:2-polyprenyl-3-methyl-5-hydroxy-6-metoxy-1,4-benzoquinol methylase
MPQNGSARRIDFERIRSTFLLRDSPLYKKRESIEATSHLNKMINNEKALQQKLERCRYVSEILNVHGKKILDFGSGLGFLSCYLAVSGADEVTGVEVVKTSLNMSSFFAEEIFCVKNVNFITSVEQLKQETYDVILLNNVISHIDQPFEMLKKLSKLLKMSGLMFIEDNNNFRSVFVRSRNKKLWIDSDIEYQIKREKFITIEFRENISSDDAQKLAEMTYGLDYNSIRWWVNEHLVNRKNMSVLDLLKKHAPIDPDILIYHENSFTPKEVQTILFNLGFIVLESHPKYVFDFKKNCIVSFLFQTLQPLAFFVAPAYEIIGLKCRRFDEK